MPAAVQCAGMRQQPQRFLLLSIESVNFVPRFLENSELFWIFILISSSPHDAKRRADKPLRISLLRVLNGAHTACTRASRGLFLAHERERVRLSINLRIFQAQQMIFVVGVAIWIPVLLHGDELPVFQDLERFLE